MQDKLREHVSVNANVVNTVYKTWRDPAECFRYCVILETSIELTGITGPTRRPLPSGIELER